MYYAKNEWGSRHVSLISDLNGIAVCFYDKSPEVSKTKGNTVQKMEDLYDKLIANITLSF